jgi:hypothetical protein
MKGSRAMDYGTILDSPRILGEFVLKEFSGADERNRNPCSRSDGAA